MTDEEIGHAVANKLVPPSLIQQALRHINSIFPEVTRVDYDKEWHWAYQSADGSFVPDFDGKPVDYSLLEEACDTATDGATYFLE